MGKSRHADIGKGIADLVAVVVRKAVAPGPGFPLFPGIEHAHLGKYPPKFMSRLALLTPCAFICLP